MKLSVTKLFVYINIGGFVLINPYFAGGLFSVLGLVPGDFHFWQPLTSMFLHGSLMHIAFNMIALWTLGQPLERDMGAKKFAILYFVSGLGGALAVLILPGHLYTPTIGASGAILGLLGAMAVFYPKAEMMIFFFPMRAQTAAFVFGGFSLLLAFVDQSSGISHAGHLGGLVVGLLVSKVLLGQRRERLSHYASRYHTEDTVSSALASIFRAWRGKAKREDSFVQTEDSGYNSKQVGKVLVYDPYKKTFYLK